MSTVRRTSTLTLTVVGGVGLIAGRIARPIIEYRDGVAPTVGWAPSLALLLGAAILGGLAWSTFQSLHKRGERMTSDHGVKLLSLAKASAIVGALVAGGYFGYALGFVDAWNTALGHERVVRSTVVGMAGLLLVAAALLLERALQVPGDHDGEGGAKSSRDGEGQSRRKNRHGEEGPEGAPA